MRKVIGYSIATSPIVAILIAAGIDLGWWFPPAMLAGIAVVGGLMFIGISIAETKAK